MDNGQTPTRSPAIQAMVDRVNGFLCDSALFQMAVRRILIEVTTIALQECGQYQGFTYCYWIKTGHALWKAECQLSSSSEGISDLYLYGPSMDQTRIFFY